MDVAIDRTFGLAWILGAALAGGAQAQQPIAPPPAPPPSAKPAEKPAEKPAAKDESKPDPWVGYTQFGAEVLDVVDGVLLGKVAEVTPMRGTDVVRVTILAWRHGARPQENGHDAAEVTLLAAPGDFFVGNDQLLFLKRYEKGPRFIVHNRIAKSDPDWDAKLAVLDHNVALRALPKDEERRREVRKRLYDDLASRVNWTRWHGYQELAWLKRHQAKLVTREDREDLRKLMERCEDPKLAKSVGALLEEWER
jgi:hypothetical protein